MIGKLFGHRFRRQRNAMPISPAMPSAAVNDELGAAMQAAIAKGQPKKADVVKLRRPRR